MEKQYDLVIIGSGPAGLAAAIYAQRARLNTLVIEKEMMSGGQVLSTYEVDNYPGLPGINGFDLGMKLRQHADQLEAVFCEDEVEGIELVKAEEQQGEEQLQAAELREISDSMMSKSAAEKTGNSAVMKLIDRSGKKDAEVYKKANVDRKLFSKIRNNPDYKPSKPTAVAFAIALELSLPETRDLIARAGYALSPSSKFDVIIEYFIMQRDYDIFKINEALFAFDQSLLDQPKIIRTCFR